MRHKKIGQELSVNIANAIAAKAFAHLLPAAQEACEAVANEAYDLIDARINFAALSEYGFTYKRGTSTVSTIRIYADKDNYLDLSTTARSYGFNMYRNPSFEDAGLYARALEAQRQLASLTERRNQLHRELSSQLLGKTTKQAIEAWPEAAEIIASTAKIDGECLIVKPLEALLARFIPALPAPQGEPA